MFRLSDTLHQDQCLLMNLMDKMADHIYFKDLESRFVRINRRMAEAFGFNEPQDAIGKTDFDFFFPEHARRAYNDEQAIIRTGSPLLGIEEKKAWPDGRETWVSTTKMPFRDQDNRIIGTFGISRDITAQKQTQQAFFKEQYFFKALMDNMLSAIYFKDREARFIRVNKCMLDRRGLRSEADLLGKTDFAILPQALAQAAFDRDMHILQTGEPLIGFEVQVPTADGSEFWVSTTKVPFRNPEGEIVGLIGISHNITERKQAERRLHKLTAMLQISNRELESFASVASHDLQEPLRKIQSFGDLLIARFSQSLPEEARGYLERMQNAAGRMRTLIEDLLTLSRVTREAQPFAPVDTASIVREVVSDLEVRIQQHGGRIEVGKLPSVEADSTQIRQLFQNLIGNALKFHRENEPPVVRVQGERLRRREDFPTGANPEVESCLFTVSDNGIGFDEKYLDKIFAIFQRLHGRSQYEGNGIGLAVCQKIAERHHGHITARSKPGEGTTFLVVLPMKQAQSEALAHNSDLSSTGHLRKLDKFSIGMRSKVIK